MKIENWKLKIRKPATITALMAVMVLAFASLVAANLGGPLDPPPPDLSRGLVGYWQFNGDPSDSSAYGNTGTLLDTNSGNGDGDTPPQLTSDRDGNTNYAYSFDGTDDLIKAETGARSNTPSGFTMSAWVNLNDTGGTILEKKGDVEITPQEFKLYDQTIGEAGTFQSPADGAWKTIKFRSDYTSPVVVGTTNTSSEENALVFEARSVTGSSAEMRVCESEGQTQSGCDIHPGETVSYLVIDAADTSNVAGIEAGTFDISGAYDFNKQTVTYSGSYTNAPAVFGAVQTTNGNGPVEFRTDATSTTDFQAGICEQTAENACNGSHVTETVGWVAIEPGNVPFVQQGEVGTTSITSSTWTSVSFASAFGETPAVISEIQTQNGGQDLHIDEARNVTTTGAEVRYCELDGPDTCDSHASEDVDWFAVEKGLLSASTLSQSHTVTTGSWVNIIYTHDGSTATVYENGSQVAQGSLSTSTHKTLEFKIGELANGAIDGVRVYDRVLTSEEISQIQDFSTPPGGGVRVMSQQGGLFGHWSLGEGFGAKDRTPNSNDGILTDNDGGNGDGDTPPQLTTDRRGNAGSAYSFDGTDDYIDLSGDASPGQANDLTVSAWAKAPASGGGWMLGEGAFFRTYMSPGGSAIWWIREENSGASNSISGGSVAADTWHHFVGTYDSQSGVQRLYVDGVEVASATPSYAGLGVNHNSFAIGWAYEGATTTNKYNGMLDDVRIYKRVLAQQEIQDMAESYKPSVQVSDLQKGLVGHWSFNNLAKDITPYSNHGAVNGATQTTDRRGNSEKAYDFDGTDDYIDFSTFDGSSISSGSFSAWFNTSVANNTNRRIVEIGSSNDRAAIFMDGGQLYLFLLDGGSQVVNIGSSNTYHDGSWHHVAGRWSSTGSQLYIDGQEVATTSGDKTITLPSSSTGYIGEYVNGGDYYFSGKIDDVRIYNRALTASEVETLSEIYR